MGHDHNEIHDHAYLHAHGVHHHDHGHVHENQKAVVTVRNEGETIDAEELPRLFDRFHKSDRSRGMDKDGVGLGLYIVRTILEQHREKITATSKDGVTTFSFTVQLAQEHR